MPSVLKPEVKIKHNQLNSCIKSHKIIHSVPNIKQSGDVFCTTNKNKSFGSVILNTKPIKAIKKSYIKKAAKTFNEVFLRDDITEDKSLDILKRYKTLQKITDNDEYAYKMFDEAKKNFGFGDGLSLKTYTDDSFITGYIDYLEPYVNVLTGKPFVNLLRTIHHELRHKKQEYLMLNYCENLTDFLNITNKKELSEKEEKQYVDSIIAAHPKWLKQFNIQELSINNIPIKYREYTAKLTDSMGKYSEAKKNKKGKLNKDYYYNFIETDARKAAKKINDLIYDWRMLFI